MSIFKSSFRDYVKDQLEIRRSIIQIGNPPDDYTEYKPDGSVSISESTNLRRNRSVNYGAFENSKGQLIDLKPGAFLNYTLNKQCVIRMTSLVDYVDDVNLDIGDLRGSVGFERLKGATLSRNFILEGGVLSDFSRNIGGENETRRSDRPRESFPKPGQKTSLAYGDFAIGADASRDGYGIVPMPGIIDANIRTKSAYGSLREAKVNFVCHNRRQLEVLEMLYMRPGYMVLLEWGWCPFFNNDGEYITTFKTVEDNTGGRIYTNNITQNDVFQSINFLKENSSGNYDGLIGFVKNFGYKGRDDGGYDCYTELISMGEVIDSLRIPAVSVFSPDFGEDLSGRFISPTTTARSDRAFKERTGVVGARFDPTVVESQFETAVERGIFPQYSGLTGMVKSLYNYATFNSLVNTEFSVRGGDLGPEVDKVFSEQYIADKQTDIAALTGEANAPAIAKDYLKSLLKYQANSVGNDLLVKLKLNTITELNNYIIPKSGITSTSTIDVGIIKALRSSTKPFIRWDALCILINNSLIPKDERLNNTVNIVADRIYEKSTNEIIVDPLLYTPIADYADPESNRIYDFSCDSDVCFLPHQLSDNPDAAENTFMYMPDVSSFPIDYTLAAYSRETATYNNEPVTAAGNNTATTFIELTNTDKLRRIGSIFINIEMLVNIVEGVDDDDEYTLGQFIKEVWDRINKVCPNHNFVLTDDKESNNVYIIDLPVDNSSLPKDIYQFIPQSNSNTLRSFQLESVIPNSLSSTIAIQAQNPRSIEDIDGVTFAAFNRSIKNRILSIDSKPSWKTTQEIFRNAKSKAVKERNQQLEILDKYRYNFFTDIQKESNKQSPISRGNIKGILKTFQKNEAYIRTSFTKTGTFNAVIPLKFDLTLDGIGGAVIGNIFKVAPSRLPITYTKTNVGFIVFSEEQQITAGQDWTTKLGGKMILLPSEDSNTDIDGTSVITYSDPDLEGTSGVASSGASNVSRESGTPNTFDIDGQTETTGDIAEARIGDDIYLKKVYTTGISGLGPGPYALPLYNGYPKPSGTIGYSFVRVAKTVDEIGINNERVTDGFIDNVVGAFDAWNKAGLKLGTVKNKVEKLIPDGKRRIKFPEKYEWMSHNPGFSFKPDKFITDEESGLEYYIVDYAGVERKIEKVDTTNILEVWFEIDFDDTPDVNDNFLNGYVLGEGRAIPDGGDLIDTNGADYALGTSALNALELRKSTVDSSEAPLLSHFTGLYMRSDVLASNKEAALEVPPSAPS